MTDKEKCKDQMDFLAQVLESRPKPKGRFFVYGTKGVGKTTFVCQAKGHIVLPTEDGQDYIDGATCFPKANNIKEVDQMLDEIEKGKHDFKVLIIDSLSSLEHMMDEEAFLSAKDEKGNLYCDRYSGLDEIPYGKGSSGDLTIELWKGFLSKLNRIRLYKNMEIFLIGHARIKKMKLPGEVEYDSWVAQLKPKTQEIVGNWVDAVLYAKYDENINQKSEGFGVERNIASGDLDAKRVLCSSKRAAYDAKSRFDLPSQMPLDYNEFNKIIQREYEKK